MHEGALKEGGLGTEPDRFRYGHAGMNTEPARGMGSRLNHAALVPPAPDHEELDLAQLRVLLPAYLNEKGVQINVEDAGAHGWSLHQKDRSCLEGNHHA